MNRHTGGGIRKGKRVLVILKSGEHLVDKLVANRSRHLALEVNGKISKDTIRSVSIAKNQP